jgi:hypothetical protein
MKTCHTCGQELAMSDKKTSITSGTVPAATVQIGVVPTAPKSVSSPNSTLKALQRISKLA